MLKFLGLLSKKKKIKSKTTISIFVSVLRNVILEGFIEVKDFINNNNNLEKSPNLKDTDIEWFNNVVFLANLSLLSRYFEDNEVVHLRALFLDEIYKDLENDANHLAIEKFLNYENYFNELLIKHESPILAMVYALFEKYDINNFQGELFRKKKKPNPIFISELKNVLRHFIWNWDDYLEKNKLDFD